MSVNDNNDTCMLSSAGGRSVGVFKNLGLILINFLILGVGIDVEILLEALGCLIDDATTNDMNDKGVVSMLFSRVQRFKLEFPFTPAITSGRPNDQLKIFAEQLKRDPFTDVLSRFYARGLAVFSSSGNFGDDSNTGKSVLDTWAPGATEAQTTPLTVVEAVGWYGSVGRCLTTNRKEVASYLFTGCGVKVLFANMEVD